MGGGDPLRRSVSKQAETTCKMCSGWVAVRLGVIRSRQPQGCRSCAVIVACALAPLDLAILDEASVNTEAPARPPHFAAQPRAMCAAHFFPCARSFPTALRLGRRSAAWACRRRHAAFAFRTGYPCGCTPHVPHFAMACRSWRISRLSWSTPHAPPPIPTSLASVVPPARSPGRARAPHPRRPLALAGVRRRRVCRGAPLLERRGLQGRHLEVFGGSIDNTVFGS